MVGSRTTIPSRVLRKDGWVAQLAFHDFKQQNRLDLLDLGEQPRRLS